MLSNSAIPADDTINKCKEARIHNKTYRTFSYKHVRASALVFCAKVVCASCLCWYKESTKFCNANKYTSFML